MAFGVWLKASARIYSVDVSVYECLSSIPAALKRATNFLQIYQEQRPLDLIKKSIELYRSILTALIGCVKYSQQNTSKLAQAKRFLNSIVKGNIYKQSLLDSIGDVNEKADAVEGEANLCQHRRIGEIHELEVQARNRAEQNNTAERIRAIEYQMDPAQTPPKDRSVSPGRLDEDSIPHEHTHGSSPETPRKERAKIKAPKSVAQPKEPPPEEPRKMLTKDVLDIIAYNESSTAKNLYQAQNIVLEPESKGWRRFSLAANSDELRTFLLTHTASSVLSINANSEEFTALSPLSLLGSHVEQMLHSPSPILLYYFCSLNAQSGNPRANASGLIASLAGQLLSYSNLNFNFSFINSEMKQLLERDDFEALTQLFLTLLGQLSSDAYILCFIDEVTVYETRKRKKDMRNLLDILVSKVIEKQKERNLPVFKLLLTDGATSWIDDIVGRENVLELSKD